MSDFATRLCEAAGCGDVDALEAMLGTGDVTEWVNCSPDVLRLPPGEPLRRAVKNNRAAAAQFLLNRGADVDAERFPDHPSSHPFSGHTPLFDATDRRYPEVMTVLLAAGANPNITRQGYTPMCWAVNAITCRKCCALLLAAGARIDTQYRTPL